MEQLAHIGGEIERAIRWRDKNKDYFISAVYRALELICLTVDDEKNRYRLKEVLRLRELIVDYFLYDNKYKSSDDFFKKYFSYFYSLARNRKDKEEIWKKKNPE